MFPVRCRGGKGWKIDKDRRPPPFRGADGWWWDGSSSDLSAAVSLSLSPSLRLFLGCTSQILVVAAAEVIVAGWVVGVVSSQQAAFGYLIPLLIGLVQIKYQNYGNPFQTHGATLSLFVVAVFIHAIALAVISKPTPNPSYLPVLTHVYFIFGMFACGLLLLLIIPPLGWIVLILWVSILVWLLYKSYKWILQHCQEMFHLICRSSGAFNRLGDWFLPSPAATNSSVRESSGNGSN